MNELLADFFTSELVKAGHPNPTAWKEGLHPDALKSSTPLPVQRFLINRQLRLIFGAMDPALQSDTSNERFSLVDTGEISSWKRIVCEIPLRCMVKHHLP
jgi:hypothetical protein